MGKNPLVSIIVPVYNVEKYLVKCLDSICSQTLKDIEIICVNDGSTDGSLKILEEYQKKDERIRIITQSNQGLSAARNTGLEIATGKYIGFVDSDDFISLNMYEDLYNTIVKYDTDVVICNHFSMVNNSITGGSKHVYNQDGLLKTEKEYIYNLLKDESIQNFVWSRLYKMEVLDGVRFRVGRVFEDVYLSVDLLGRINSAYYLNEPLYCYRIREGSITSSLDDKGLEDSINSVCLMFSSVKERFPDLLNLNVFYSLKLLAYMMSRYNKKDIDKMIKKYKEKIKLIFDEIKNVDLKEFSNNIKYNDVLKFIGDYKKIL